MKVRALVIICTGLMLVGCFGDDGNIVEFVHKTKKQARGVIEPLPEMKEPEKVSYTANNIRSPFLTITKIEENVQVASTESKNKQRKINRTLESLEYFPIAALQLKGVISNEDVVWGLVQDSEGSLHQVQVGNYIGQNAGRVVDITPSSIVIEEEIDDGYGKTTIQEVYLKLVH